MILIIIKIVLIILLVRVIALTIGHLTIVFWDHATKMGVDEIMKNPEEYVRTEHMCKFMYNMIWIAVFIKLLYAAFTGHIEINT
jgi:hypothetical protein